ncbi:ABC transporter G family member 2, putative [Plasmodium malariae]|uniref:ABC transporter G family member 2, putative n=2 Tax=Plasmodium (Plasmodium) TaxID=418103 RepID=A0A1A8W9P1_PLAMA|nr:ABC transporter G family member 2, putative [Plasmodium malariae]SBS89547.1 ABC transporter G family member 2, putative [Plasmodium malariae]SCP02689.1 ABC transporter G family member 2, putative [Plasmodium malariae]
MDDASGAAKGGQGLQHDKIKYEFSNVKYTVDHGKLEILHGIKGMLLPKTITVIMGPSGSGKTTLLNILSLKVTDGVQGKFLINGMNRTKHIKSHMGYVLQDDYFFSRLTVYETIEFTAKLKLDIRDKNKLTQLVNSVLDIMSLSHVKDTIVGDAFIRGISGGQRKRLSIANEILSNPPLLLMDEPTSGLDSSSALSLVECIQRIATMSNTTIISSLHQPSSQVFAKFDRLIAITNGYIIYHGKTTELNKYLKKIGFICPYGWNVADYLMDILCNNKFEIILLENYNKFLQFDNEEGYFMNISAINNTVIHDDYDASMERELSAAELKQKADSGYCGSGSAGGSAKVQIVSMQESKAREQDLMKLKSVEILISLQTRKTPYLRQNFFLLIRGLKKIITDEITIVKVIDLVVILTLFGFLWLKTFKEDTEEGIIDTIGAIFFILSYWTFYPAYLSLYSFPSEREVIAKERNMKTFQVSNYFFSKLCAEFIYFFIIIAFWMLVTHLVLYGTFKVGIYISYAIVTLLNALISCSLGYFISTLFDNFSKAVSFLSVVLLTMTLTNGFYVEIAKLQIPFRYLQWLSYQTYSASILAKIKYDNALIKCSPENLSQQCKNHGVFPGNVIIDKRFAKLHISISVLILISFYVIIKISTYISLRWSHALKMK